MKKSIIEVKNIVKTYKNVKALRGVSFDVKEGEIFGLLGPNGAGKTTLLEIMETLKDETEGDVIINGYSINKDPQKIKKIIGIQLQAAGFYPNLNLSQLINLFNVLYNAKVDSAELLSKVGLLDKKNTIFKDMSGGQKQRFSIATTLINNPKVVFLDEPTTGLDPQSRRNLWELIKEINKKGTTIILTTHYMDEAEYLCHRVGIIDNGQIIKIDTPQNLINDLVRSGFKSEKVVNKATLEDVFITLTGKELRDE